MFAGLATAKEEQKSKEAEPKLLQSTQTTAPGSSAFNFMSGATPTEVQPSQTDREQTPAAEEKVLWGPAGAA